MHILQFGVARTETWKLLVSDLDPASYMVKGPDKNLPIKYGHVGPDELDQRWLNLHGSMQWYIIQSVQKIKENFYLIFFFLKISIFSEVVKIAEN